MHCLPKVESFASRPVFDEGLKRAASTATNTASDATHDYFVRSLGATKPREVLKRALSVSQHFVVLAPVGHNATLARAALHSALVQLCPAYEAAHRALASHDFLGSAMGAMTGALAGKAATSINPLSSCLIYEPGDVERAARDMWARMCIQERMLMRWAQRGDASVFEMIGACGPLLTQNTHDIVEKTYQSAASAFGHDLDYRDMRPLTQAEQQSYEQWEALCKARNKPSIRNRYNAEVKQQNLQLRAAQLWPAYCRLYLNAAQTLDVPALIALYATPEGRRYARTEQKVAKDVSADISILVTRAWDRRSMYAISSRFTM